jgi:hypothetical protein
VRRERNKSTSTFTRRTRKTNHLLPFRLSSGKNEQRKSSAPQQLFRASQRIQAIRRTHEHRTFLPEFTGDRTKRIDPRSALSFRDSGVTRGTKNRRRSSTRKPHRETAARKTTTWKN